MFRFRGNINWDINDAWAIIGCLPLCAPTTHP